MSHSKERVEKICLNCGTALTDRYCQHCGQENTEPKETVWTLFSHFFNDITHFDGKFFSTVKLLITKPGFLSAEYINGRRASYLHPIRMYVFTSAFFFIIFFSLFNPVNLVKEARDHTTELKELHEAGSSLREKLPAITDTVLKNATLRSISNIDAHAYELEKVVAVEGKEDSVKRANRKTSADSSGIKIKINPLVPDEVADSIAAAANADPIVMDDETLEYRSKIAYDSVQKELPESKRDGWVMRVLTNRLIVYKTKYKDDAREARVLIMEKLLHMLPQALFVSLPVFALILMMLYARRKFFYAEHGIFTIHVYCANFLMLIFYFGIDRMQVATGWKWLAFVKAIFVLIMLFYLYKAMRNFYLQGRGKTILKFILLNLLSLIVVIIISLALTALSVIRFS